MEHGWAIIKVIEMPDGRRRGSRGGVDRAFHDLR
jgi:hypothetical protein